MQLDPHLSQIEQTYMELVASVQNQHMTPEVAEEHLKKIKVIDGDGVEWSMNARGEFLSAPPGQDPVPTDPARYAPMRVPGQGPVVSSVEDGGVFPQHSYPDATATARGGPAYGFEPEHSLNSSGAAGSIGGKFSGFTAFLLMMLRGKLRTVLVVAGALVIGGILLSMRGGSSETNGETPTVTPGVEESENGTEPGTGDIPAPDPDIEPFTLDRANAFVSALQSASSEDVVTYFYFENNPNLRIDALELLGATRAGLTLNIENFQREDSNHVLLQVGAYRGSNLLRVYNLRIQPVGQFYYITEVSVNTS